MVRITSFSKQVIVFFLVSALIIRPTFASNNIGGWTLSNPVAQGAKVAYDGLKNVMINGANVTKKATAIIAPNANEVAKVLGKGVAGVALSVAVEQLLGAVDWVLDPANNEIRYKIPIDPTCSGECLYRVDALPGLTFSSASSACSAYFSSFKGSTATGSYIVDNGMPNSKGYCGGGQHFPDCRYASIASRVTFTVISDKPADQEQKIPLETVAQKVISNAESGDTDAQVATGAAAADIVAEAEKDATKAPPILKQLEAGATAETDEVAKGETKPNYETGGTDISLTFPVFCTWAPTVCEAMNVVIAFPATIAEYWSKLEQEYAEKPEENTDTQLEIPDLTDQTVDSDISFGGSCPAPLSSDINFMGLNKTIQFSFDPVCQIAEFIKPVVISISAFSAALIVAGIRTEDD